MNVFDFARMVEERRAELRLSLPRVTPSMWDNDENPGAASWQLPLNGVLSEGERTSPL